MDGRWLIWDRVSLRVSVCCEGKDSCSLIVCKAVGATVDRGSRQGVGLRRLGGPESAQSLPGLP